MRLKSIRALQRSLQALVLVLRTILRARREATAWRAGAAPAEGLGRGAPAHCLIAAPASTHGFAKTVGGAARELCRLTLRTGRPLAPRLREYLRDPHARGNMRKVSVLVSTPTRFASEPRCRPSSWACDRLGYTVPAFIGQRSRQPGLSDFWLWCTFGSFRDRPRAKPKPYGGTTHLHRQRTWVLSPRVT